MVNRGMVTTHRGSGQGGRGRKRELEARIKVISLAEHLSM